MTPESPRVSTIMVVDDSTANLKLLGNLFREKGYLVRPFSKASLALLAAQKEAPDLFLLDINMPEMDGYELCRRLKAIDSLSSIPVIFLSTLQDLQDKVKAFECGAVDYVTKQPFHFEEIYARVHAHMRVRELQRDLEARNEDLRRNLEQLRRLEELKDNLTHMIVHDMRSPLTVIVMATQMLAKPESGLSPQDQGNIELAHNAAEHLVDMTTTLLDISRLEAGKMPLNLDDQELGFLSKGCIDSLSILLRRFDTGVVRRSEGMLIARCDKSIVSRVLVNLLGNAAKFTPDKGRITVSLAVEGDFIRVSVTDSGPGIPKPEQALIFEKFGQGGTGKKVQGTGLGLTFCRLAIEAHGGTIGLESEPGKGATFWFTLPRAKSD